MILWFPKYRRIGVGRWEKSLPGLVSDEQADAGFSESNVLETVTAAPSHAVEVDVWQLKTRITRDLPALRGFAALMGCDITVGEERSRL